MAKSTDELMKILKNESNIEKYIEENKEDITSVSLTRHIAALLEDKNLTAAKVARRGQMSDSYFYKISQGVKENPSRDKIIQMCFGFALDAEESREFMRAACVGELYPRVRRDSIILFCLENHIDILECEKMLEDAGDKKILRE
ncbi:MAG: helix-turn-helix domain-containing protein [Clostridia bacterium]|nr:helix-turn-helix domain-containing protein [Clostridia bacterium]MBQ2670122.1 helix-turn-helix domain-containing protein [Clostridia bacterium]MBQ3464122.1 helix-turn-helix domain-containing protein [Clostridia bacterium]MBQ6557815.1 helix-turn-helix domain-containing protein [Clostridia bacterium]MBQ9599154.1 helix-turn-helix domain-containing protein [Clostridia bacterium]